MAWVDRLLDLSAGRALNAGYIQREGEWLVGTDGHILIAVLSDEQIPEGKECRNEGMPAVFDKARTFVPSHRTTLGALREWVGERPEPGECETCKGTKKRTCRVCRGSKEVECRCPDCDYLHYPECDDCDGTGDEECVACGLGRALPSRPGTIAGITVNRNLLVNLLPHDDGDTVVLIGCEATNTHAMVLARTDDWCVAWMSLRTDAEAPAVEVIPA